MKKVIIFGTNDLAQLAHYYFNTDPQYMDKLSVMGFLVDKEYKKFNNEKNTQLPIFTWEELFKFNTRDILLFAPTADNKLREKVYKKGIENGFRFISYVSSKCINFAPSIGENCFILENNTIQPFTTIGNNVVLWSGNHIGHHSTLEDNVFVTSHVVMSGHCHIKKGAYLGVNSTLRDGITIGENAVVGMGAVVTRSIPDNQTWIGNPAKQKI